jgi:chorismate dehydratase
MIRLGHISYSNCFPVHALLVDRPPPPDLVLVTDVPGRLNRALAAGAIDIAPCSSIELARNPRYRLLADLAIASDGPVRSILLETERPPESLDGCTIHVPTASATSVVLLRILLELRYGVRPRLEWFDQAATDPFADGAEAALWIGDVALARGLRSDSGRPLIDLGRMWTEWTGLPFAYAVWQTALPPVRDAELRRLHALLLESRAYFDAHAAALSARHAAGFGVAPGVLLDYWRSLRYTLDDRVERGLLHFFALAARLGEAPACTALSYVRDGGGGA